PKLRIGWNLLCQLRVARRRWRVAPVSEKNASRASAKCALRSFMWRVAHLHSSPRALRRKGGAARRHEICILKAHFQIWGTFG
ncbi:hypothetical protein A2U01_0086233, partial [Trifolium medium]|nr:hypothetical protein [Trifolium medium]